MGIIVELKLKLISLLFPRVWLKSPFVLSPRKRKYLQSDYIRGCNLIILYIVDVQSYWGRSGQCRSQFSKFDLCFLDVYNSLFGFIRFHQDYCLFNEFPIFYRK